MILCLLATQLASAEFDSIRSEIQTKLVAEKVPSLSIAVAKDGRVLWKEAFGLADREHKTQATTDTIYEVGSISKPLTATGLMTLVESGAVDLDKPANVYLGSSPLVTHIGDASKATVRSLANHTSGLPRHAQLYFVDEGPRPSMTELIRRYGHLTREPGETFEYSNFGYGVLSVVIENASKTKFADFMRGSVFGPLGMKHSSVGISRELRKSYAVKYGPDQAPAPSYVSGHPGAGDLSCSMPDLLKFGLFHLKDLQPGQKRILTDTALDQMHTASARIDEGESYGLGWYVDPDQNGYPVVYHNGSSGYSTASLFLVPSEHICVAVATNMTTDLPVRIAQSVLAKMLPKYGANLNRVAGPAVQGAQPAPFKIAPELIGHWKGTVDTADEKLPVEMWFKDYGDIHCQLGGQLRTLVNGARMDGSYLRGSVASNIGTEDANGRWPYNLHLRIKQRGDALNGTITATSLPGKRVGSVLSYWIELRKAPDHSPGGQPFQAASPTSESINQVPRRAYSNWPFMNSLTSR